MEQGKPINDFEYVLNSFTKRTEVNGTSRLTVKCCGVEVERVVIGSQIAASGLPAIAIEMADEATLIAQQFYMAGIAVVPEALEVTVDHLRKSEVA